MHRPSDPRRTADPGNLPPIREASCMRPLLDGVRLAREAIFVLSGAGRHFYGPPIGVE